MTDALAEKQGLPLRNQASNALGKAQLQRHLNPFQNRHEESRHINQNNHQSFYIEWLVSAAGSLGRGGFRYGKHTSGTVAKSSDDLATVLSEIDDS